MGNVSLMTLVVSKLSNWGFIRNQNFKIHRLLQISAIIAGISYSISFTYAQTYKPGTGDNQAYCCNFKVLNQQTIEITIDIKDYKITDRQEHGQIYKNLWIKGLDFSRRLGFPEIPVLYTSLRMDTDSRLETSILEAESITIDNILLHPAQRVKLAGSTEKDEQESLKMNDSIYKSDLFLPSEVASIVRFVKYRGKSIGYACISPVQFNAAQKKVRIFKHLKFNIIIKPPVNTQNSNTSDNSQFINSFVINGTPNQSYVLSKRQTVTSDTTPDVLIITIPAFKAAADTLAFWHRMKGYHVKCAAAIYPNFQAVKDTVTKTYANASRTLKYIVILGDNEQVPAQPISVNRDGYVQDFVSDHALVCVENNDLFPDMARGRISVDNAESAMDVVHKIISYEKNPPTQSNFYKNIFTISQFIDMSPMDGYEDQSSTESCEAVRGYLEEKNYTGKMLYRCVSPTKPSHWNNTDRSWGGSLPPALLDPQFDWTYETNKDLSSIAKLFNDGCFLACYYGHGILFGWGLPLFMGDSLTNKDMLPFVLSISCESGEFNRDTLVCFGEKMLRNTTGGAIATIAASAGVYDYKCDALLYGLVDAIWPGLTYKYKGNPNPPAVPHDPIYTFGDILNYGLARMDEAWSDLITPGEINIQAFHIFGDPTTPLWTSIPQTIQATHSQQIKNNASAFSLTALNIDNGIATLCDEQTGQCFGSAQITSSSANIPVSQIGRTTGNVLLTITGHSYKPYIIKIAVSDNVNTADQNNFQQGINSQANLFVNNKKITTVSIDGKSQISVSLYSASGRLIQTKQFDPSKHQFSISTTGIAHGVYILRINSNTMHKQFQILCGDNK